MSESEVLIRCEGVSKKFCRDLKKSLWYGVTDMAADLRCKSYQADISDPATDSGEGLSGLRKGEFWASQDLNFEVRRGQCLGLVGRNGAGKTTLLKMLNGLIKPDYGRIEMKGRVAALIALGAGFNGVLTGRENIYVNGSILGLSKAEIKDKFDAIVEFAELEDAIDAPVRTYSSGMSVRLGFSVAAVLIQPDILLLDEVLAVGDIGFVIKCLNTVQEMMERSAVVFVTHRMQFVTRFCTHLLVLEHGKITCSTDDLGVGLDAYLRQFRTDLNVIGNVEATVTNPCVIINGVPALLGDQLPSVRPDDQLALRLSLTIQQHVGPVELRVLFEDQGKTPVATFPCHDRDGNLLQLPPGDHRLTLDIGCPQLAAGKYSFAINVVTPNACKRLSRLSGAAPFVIVGGKFEWAPVVRPTVTTIS